MVSRLAPNLHKLRENERPIGMILRQVTLGAQLSAIPTLRRTVRELPRQLRHKFDREAIQEGAQAPVQQISVISLTVQTGWKITKIGLTRSQKVEETQSSVPTSLGNAEEHKIIAHTSG